MIRWVALLLVGVVCAAAADEAVRFCYNWSCAAETTVVFPESMLLDLAELIQDADSPAHERELLATAIGRMYGWAAERSPIGADRAGNQADAELDGRMDCIDHSTNTQALLDLIARRGWLRFHRVAEPQFRRRLGLIPVHRSAVVEELPPGLGIGDGETNEQVVGALFVVDSWLVDPGQDAVVLPLEEWLDWGGPDVQ